MHDTSSFRHWREACLEISLRFFLLRIFSCFEAAIVLSHLYSRAAKAATPNNPTNILDNPAIFLSAAPVPLAADLPLLWAFPAAAAPEVAFEPLSRVVSAGAESVSLEDVSI